MGLGQGNVRARAVRGLQGLGAGFLRVFVEVAVGMLVRAGTTDSLRQVNSTVQKVTDEFNKSTSVRKRRCMRQCRGRNIHCGTLMNQRLSLAGPRYVPIA